MGGLLQGGGEWLARFHRLQERGEGMGRGFRGHGFAEALHPGDARRQEAVGEIHTAAAVEHHQLQPVIHGLAQGGVQARAADPATISQLQAAARLRVGVGVAEEDQRIPAGRFRQPLPQAGRGALRAPQGQQQDAPSLCQGLQGLDLAIQLQLALLPHHQQHAGAALALGGGRQGRILGRQPPEGPIQGQLLPGPLFHRPQGGAQAQAEGSAGVAAQGPMQGRPFVAVEPLPQGRAQPLAVVVDHGVGHGGLGVVAQKLVVLQEAGQPGLVEPLESRWWMQRETGLQARTPGPGVWRRDQPWGELRRCGAGMEGRGGWWGSRGARG